MSLPESQETGGVLNDGELTETAQALVIISSDHTWLDQIRQLEDPIPYLAYTETEARHYFQSQAGRALPCRLVVIDLAEVTDCIAWIRFLHGCWPQLLVAVVTSIPQWRTARLLHNAGAIDIFAKDMNRTNLENNLKRNLDLQGQVVWEDLMSRMRILCVDNILDQLEVMRDALELEFGTVSVECIHIRGLEDIIELEERLKREWWNFIIMDMALLREDEPANIDKTGLDLVVNSDPVVPKIIYTAYPSYQEWRRAAGQDSDWDLPPACQFISKLERNALDTVIRSIRQVLFNKKSPYLINFDLQVDFTNNLSFQHLVLRLGGLDAAASLNKVNQAAQELSDLFCKLFSDCQSIRISMLPFESPYFVMLEIEAMREIGIAWHGVAQIGTREVISNIQDQWNTYVTPHVKGTSASLDRFSETLNYAGITFHLDGNPRDYCGFPVFYHHSPTEEVIATVKSLFMGTFSEWYTGNRRESAEPLGKLYRQMKNLDGQGHHLLSRLVSILQSSPEIKPTRKPNVLGIRWTKDEVREIALPPADFLDQDDPFDIEDMPELCITAGDFHRQALLIGPQNQIWLMGSPMIGEGFSLRDFISLEAEIMFHLMVYPANEVDQPEQRVLRMLRGWLTPDSLGEEILASGWEAPGRQKALALINTIRHQAWIAGNQTDIRLYYQGLFFHAVEVVLQTSAFPRGREKDAAECAALAVLLLYDRLLNWPDWQLSLKLRAKQIEILKDHPQVRVPWKPEPIELRPMELALIKFMNQRPGKVISYSEILKAVWSDGAAGYENIYALVRGLRKAIEPDPSKPRYLITFKGEGLEYRPDGKPSLERE